MVATSSPGLHFTFNLKNKDVVIFSTSEMHSKFLHQQLLDQHARVHLHIVELSCWSRTKVTIDWMDTFLCFNLVENVRLMQLITSECKRWRIPTFVKHSQDLSDFDLKLPNLDIPTPSASPAPVFEELPSIPLVKTQAALTLVGAGPGDPRFLTLAALEAIKEADLIVSDRLVSLEIKSMVDPLKLKIAAKVCGKQALAQHEINQWCLEGLQQGKKVVRLKGGDPFMFGRGGEELLHFQKLGFPVSVVPGISSSLAAPLSALIPVTHRALADQVLISTGRRENGTMPDFPDYSPKRTLVFLMAIGASHEIIDILLSKGYPGHLPAAVIEKATCPDQRVLRGRLDGIVKDILEANVTHHATLVIGDVVNVLQPSLSEDEGVEV